MTSGSLEKYRWIDIDDMILLADTFLKFYIMDGTLS